MRLRRRLAEFRTTCVVAFLTLVAVHDARAQCPDGYPPPCRATTAVVRRTAPSLNDRQWIVVPFTNVTRAPELEWLRDASVNLLSLDLGRWTDIDVVDGKRVADLLRTLPAARATQGMSLNDGMSLARQAGAGRLVMGDFIKVGRTTRLVANVFEVRNGARLRSVQQPVSDPDSLLTAFGPLARAVLAVPPPSDATVGATGTTSADAYREYLDGLASLNRFDLADARRHLLTALKFDSTFALAHYKLSIAMHWAANATTDAERARGSELERLHAAAAARLGGALPPRERALISSRLASAGGDPERACTTLATLARRDSLDAEALYALGDCRYHAGFLPPEPTADTTRGRFRGDWNGAIAAFRRTLLLDPTYHPAFEHVIDILTTPNVSVCAVEVAGCSNDPGTYAAWIIRDADTLVIQPVRGNFTVKTPLRARQDATRSPLLNLQQAQRIAREWADAGPGEARAHLNLAKLDMQLGDLVAATSELALIPAKADATVRVNVLEARVQVATMLGKGDAGRAALDTLAREMPEDSTKALRIAVLASPFGRVRPLVAAMDAYGVAHGWSAERRAYNRNRPYVMMGVPLSSLLVDEQRYGETLPNDTLCAAGRPRCRATDLFFTLVYAPRAARTWSPYNGRSAAGARFFSSYALTKGDTATVRIFARFVDSVGTAARRSGNDDLGLPLHASELYLALGDSVAAMQSTRVFTDSTLTVLSRTSTSNDDWEWPYLLAPRMMKQRGDLAMRMGYVDEARTWYERVLSLWSDADPEFKAEVARLRSALAAMGTKR